MGRAEKDEVLIEGQSGGFLDVVGVVLGAFLEVGEELLVEFLLAADEESGGEAGGAGEHDSLADHESYN